MNKPKLILSSTCSAITTIIFIVVITIWAELSAPLKNWLTNFSGHHWTSKSILSILLYGIITFVLYWSPHAYSHERLHRMLNYLILSTILGTIIISLFFTGHHLKYF
jgi:hypothetical protein